MSKNVKQIIEQLKTLTLLESTELVSQIEEVFGVDTSISTSGMLLTNSEIAGEEVIEEKTTFDVIVENVSSDKRVAVLKVIRKLTSLGLADAKAFTTALPKTLKEGVSKEEADEAKKLLEEAGAKITIN